MTLLLAIKNSGGNWSATRWRERFTAALPGRHIALHGVDAYEPAAIRYAAVWKPEPGVLARLPNLAAMFNLGAGVDALLEDNTLPPVPLVRLVIPDLTHRMTEYVTLHVLLHHRRLPQLLAAQRDSKWLAEEQWSASAVRVGILGLGTLGSDAAEVLLRLGFQVSGWSRTERRMPGVTCYHGDDQRDAFLAHTDILVVLVPLTDATRGSLNRRLFDKLARDGVLGAPVLINAGRGGLQIETDILSALDDGTLGGATLDVFETEPLPTSSRLWTHPKVIITPHNASDSDPDVVSATIAAQIIAHEQGAPLCNCVDRKLGY